MVPSYHLNQCWPGRCPTHDVLIEFEIRPKFEVLWLKMYSVPITRKCHDMCKISLWLAEYVLNYSTPNFYKILNLTKILLVGQGPGSMTPYGVIASSHYLNQCRLTLIVVLDIHQGAVSIRKTVLPGMAIPMLKIRRPNGRLIFNMEITIRR